MTVNLATFKPDLHFLGNESLVHSFRYHMKPEGSSPSGFIAEGEDLATVCQRDSAYLQNRGITHEQIADRLESVLVKVDFLRRETLGAGQRELVIQLLPKTHVVIIERKLRVSCLPITGRTQECPFSNDSTKPKSWCGWGTSSYQITNIATGESLVNVSELHPHLIRDHHLFEGSVPCRIDPALAIRVLSIQPGVDYQPKLLGDHFWRGYRYLNAEREAFKAVREDRGEYLDNPQFTAFLVPYGDYKERNPSEAQRAHDLAVIERVMKFLGDSDDEGPELPSSGTHMFLHLFPKNLNFGGRRFYRIGEAVLVSDDIEPGCSYSVYDRSRRKVPVLESGDYLERPFV